MNTPPLVSKPFNQKISTWLYATRPHTLGASVAPMLVLLGSLIREVDGWEWVGPYILAFLVALFAQVSSNLANDYFDYVGGKDTDERLGFTRLLSAGMVSPREMKVGLIISTLFTTLCGVLFSYLEGWWVLIVGALVLVAMIAYSAGPYPLSHHGLGDLAVVLFYGLVPILVPYYALEGEPFRYLFFLALGMGLWETNILVCNNYRDYLEDLKSGKHTLIVQLGEHSGPWLYTINAALAFGCFVLGVWTIAPHNGGTTVLLIVALIMGGLTYLCFRKKGEELNQMLKLTNLTALLIGILLFVLMIL